MTHVLSSKKEPEDWRDDNDASGSYAGIVQDMREAAKQAGAGEITDAEAHEAARNFIGFFKTLLEIERGKGLDEG